MGHGGKRPGAGKPKGYKHQNTRDKEWAREQLRAMVIRKLEPLVEGMIDAASGLKRLIMHDPKTGKLHRVDDAELDEALASGNATFVYTKEPNVAAFSDLLNRAIGKPVEEVELSGGFEVDVIAQKLIDARKRHLQRVLEEEKKAPVVAELQANLIPEENQAFPRPEVSPSKVLASEERRPDPVRVVRTWRSVPRNSREWS